MTAHLAWRWEEAAIRKENYYQDGHAGANEQFRSVGKPSFRVPQ
jgi:hypothetical protein